MQNNYIKYHLHTMLSNPITNIDSVNNYKHYIDRAKECGMKAIGFSEHGNCFEWLHKKEYCETCKYQKDNNINNCNECNKYMQCQGKNKIKYIHGVEVYVTENADNKIRDNYHVILMAKNYDGFKEINTLVSKSFNRAEVKVIDNIERFYYQPRITFQELINTSNNIIITTACIGGILGKENNIQNDFIKFLSDNKDRCFLEIQHHNVNEQKEYNKKMYELSKIYGLKLIAGTDTHSLDDAYAKGRLILQKAKKTYFDSEEGWDLTFKTYDELVKSYKIQNILPENIYLEAINNTNLLYDMIEEFEVDRSYKYPIFSDNPEQEIYNIINKNLKKKNIELTNELKNRIDYEIETYKHNNALNFLLLENDVKSEARKQNIAYGDSRGSVSGSMVAYLMQITNSNSIKHNLNFERFMNKERVSLADIDTDWSPSQRDKIKQYLHSNPKYHTAEIITFNTIADKGAIRDIGRALEIPLKDVDIIAKNIENDEENLRLQYPKLFEYVDLLKGVVVSMGSHPAATICSPVTLYDNVGTITLSTNNYPVSCLNMKEIDSLNFVKLDVLGLDNVEIIAKTCELAGIEKLTSDNVDDKDEDVWKDIMKSPLSIFQFESNFAHSYLRKVFSKETLEKIKAVNPDINYIDLMSMANGAIRPAGESYREALANGDFKDNGHESLNKLLSSTNGYLVYQEQIIEFLNKFCGFTMGEADIVRRGFAKKTGTDKYIPKIKSGFIKTMNDRYNINKEESLKIIESFLKVIEDASDYLFSYNHALPYSYIGYICGWLRYYYPLEFLSVVLNINEDNQEKTGKIFDYITDFTDIKIKPIKFRRSKNVYMINKEENCIYKGIKSIKYCNDVIAEEIYNLRNNEYKNFTELLYDLNEKTSLDNRHLDILIKLDFFSEFGMSRSLNTLVVYFDLFKKGNAKQIDVKKIEDQDVVNNIVKRFSRLSPSGKTYMNLNTKAILLEIEQYLKTIDKKDYSIKQKIGFQEEFLGHISFMTEKEEDKRKLIILNVTPLVSQFKNNETWAYAVETMSIGSGKKSRLNIWYAKYEKIPLIVNDIIYANKVEKNKKGYWYLTDYTIINSEFN